MFPATPDNPGSGRIIVVHPCIVPGDYPSVNLRLFELKPVSPEWIVEKGMLSLEMVDYLGGLVAREQRGLICGETRTGNKKLVILIICPHRLSDRPISECAA